jgi:phosphatidylglycerophosphatase A
VASALPASAATTKKPSVAFAIATALGVGYLPKAPGTFGSLVGILTAILTAFFFVRPSSLRAIFSADPLGEAILRENALLPGSSTHDTASLLALIYAIALLILLVVVGVWSCARVEAYSGIHDPQYVVIDEVAGQHIALVLPLLPVVLPHLTARLDLSQYLIFAGLSLVNWKYLLAGFVLFRLFDIWKPFPLQRLEKLRSGWGIMADDWGAGIYAAIVLKLALYFGLI